MVLEINRPPEAYQEYWTFCTARHDQSTLQIICEVLITCLKVLRGDEWARENQAASATRVDTDPGRTQLEGQATFDE